MEKGKSRIEVDEGRLISNLGLEGDAYSKPGDREVCLMSIETKKKLADYQDGLCVKRFVETLLIDLSPAEISVGDHLLIGDAEIKITKKGKRCFPECTFVQNKISCPLVSEPLFGKVVKSGEIKRSF
ncbi:MAG: hypothetical protein JEZ08_15770 [Clostridiales bacterium]|nr:hypothetical protein [Clostridiales bacterium]